jgi:hypothetical protein
MNFYMGINIAAGWLFDHGLENAIDEMKALFNKRELYILYLRHVDPLFRLEIEKTASAIQKDKKNGPEMARRLRFSDYQSFASANPRSIVEHFFIAMNHPPKKKAPLLRNAEYLKTAYTLSALFAPFDNGMKIIAKEIDGNRAQLQFHGNNLKMVAYFSRRNGKWFLTRSGI